MIVRIFETVGLIASPKRRGSMFKIALVNHSKEEVSKYTDAFAEKDCTIHKLENMEAEKQIKTMDALLIKEDALEEIGHTCELIVRIRQLTNQCIWVVSEESTKINRVVYLQLGSDGTFDQNVDLDELSLHVRTAVERRKKISLSPIQTHNSQHELRQVSLPHIHLIPNNFSVNVKDQGEVSLTKLEFKALEILVENRGNTVSYEQMYQTLWGTETKNQKYRISNVVFHLRKKLGDDPFKPRFIKTVRSRGYMLAI